MYYLIKTIAYSHNTRVVFKLCNNKLSFCLKGRSRGKIFLDSKIFTILTKSSLNVLGSFPLVFLFFFSRIIIAPSNKVMIFLDFNLLPKIGFTAYYNFFDSVLLLMLQFSKSSPFLFFSFCIRTLILLFYLLKTFILILTLTFLFY